MNIIAKHVKLKLHSVKRPQCDMENKYTSVKVVEKKNQSFSKLPRKFEKRYELPKKIGEMLKNFL